MGDNHSLLFEELGRTETVKDVEAAYKAIFEAKRQFAVRMKHAKRNHEKQKAEIETFLDDLVSITGLPLGSPLFAKIASLTVAMRLARRNLLANEFRCALEEGFEDDGAMKDFPW